MDFERLKMALAELRPEDRLSATFHHWNETPKTKGDETPCASAYAGSIMVNRRVRWIIWGHGYAREAIPPVVFGIDRLLKIAPSGRWIEVSALANLWQYMKYGGIGRYAMKTGGWTKSETELGCYPAIGTIIEASDARRWSLSLQPPLQNAPGYAEAAAWARGKAKTAALQHKADHAPTSKAYPKPIILQEIVVVFPG